MNREILFRGQTRKQGEKVRMDGTPVDGNWVYGGIFQGSGDFSIIYGSTDPDNISISNIEKHVVHTDTVGQYTGLTDKNGKKIFDGDVLRLSKGSLCVVKYGNRYRKCGFVVGYVNGAWDDVDNINGHDSVEVIGNIHNNPELMGGEDDG